MAERQHGVVSIRQLLGPLGHTEREVERATESRRLHRVFTGVYAVGHRNLSPHGWCLAAVLACGPDAVLSHFSAAWLWGIARTGPAPYEVTTPIPRRRKPPRIVVHRARNLLDADRALVEGIPVTAVARTLLDLAARSRPQRLRGYLERGEELGLLDLGPIGELLERTKGHHGHGRLRRAAALYVPPPFTRSRLERRFLDAILAAGLPRPSVNSFVAGYELDMYWPEHRFAVELDAYKTHGTREAFERDRVRQEELLLAGIETVRLTGARFDREPDAVIARIGRLLEERRQRPMW
jgi:transcriptional regulator with AbiEi antitoxin domain of type IV toxin-antitoxin system